MDKLRGEQKCTRTNKKTGRNNGYGPGKRMARFRRAFQKPISGRTEAIERLQENPSLLPIEGGGLFFFYLSEEERTYM